MRAALIDRYVLRLAVWPMLGCLGVTVISMLLERVLRLLDMLSQSSSRFSSVAEAAANLLPHYLGLALPVAFFVALFMVITRLDDGSEIEAFLASGVPLTRLAAPYVALGLMLTAVSLVVFGYLQPYSRYAYRAAIHAAINAGWNGRLYGGAFVVEGDSIMTADAASLEGRRLQRIFIRRTQPGGGEEVITASTAELTAADDKHVTLVLRNGSRIGESRSGNFDTLNFDALVMPTDLAGASALLRARGGDERELTLGELAVRAMQPDDAVIPRRVLLAELYARLARSFVLPFLPLIAFPLGLAAKRKRRAAGLLLAGVLLLAFQHGVQYGQGLAEAGKAPAGLAVGTPFFAFTAFCVWMFAGSRRRPGETPIGRFVQQMGDGIEQIAALVSRRKTEPAA